LGKEKKDIFESIWSALASVKLAIFLLIMLSLTSIVGTIVEQNAEPAQNIKLLAKFFGDSSAPSVYNIFAKLGFMDMYDSWWFLGLLALFGINLIVCSIERFPKTWKVVQAVQRPKSENALKSFPVKKELKLKTTLNIAKDEFFNALTASRYSVLEATEEGSVQLYTQKGRYARLAVYVVHLSIILIFAGAIIGSVFGFKGYLNIPEGAMFNVAYESPTEEIPLGFSIKCNWYETLYYDNMDSPKDFRSELVVYEDGKEVMKKIIEVNDPLTYKGITFFQSNYGMMPDTVGSFILDITPNNGPTETIWLRFGDTFKVPGTGIKGTIMDYSPALTRDRSTGALTTYSENMVNLAIKIKFEEPGREPYVGWILQRYPDTGVLNGGHTVILKDYWGVEYTGLSVSKDPGVWLIYLASILMSVGLYICFFVSHKKIWINIAGAGSSVSITVGASTNRNRLSLEQEIEKLISHASKAIEGRTS
jgi:cytochrome c biogenesis protein